MRGPEGEDASTDGLGALGELAISIDAGSGGCEGEELPLLEGPSTSMFAEDEDDDDDAEAEAMLAAILERAFSATSQIKDLRQIRNDTPRNSQSFIPTFEVGLKTSMPLFQHLLPTRPTRFLGYDSELVIRASTRPTHGTSNQVQGVHGRLVGFAQQRLFYES